MEDFNHSSGRSDAGIPGEEGRIPRIGNRARARYMDLKSDFGFKKIFGRQVNKAFLIHFLNTLLKEKRIRDLTYLHSEAKGLSADSRDVIFDVQCKAEDGTVFIVEMQRKDQKTFRDRTLYYATFAIQEQMRKGDSEYRIPPVYVVCILDFKLAHGGMPGLEKNAYLVSRYSLRNDEDPGEVMTEHLHFIYLELGRFELGADELVTDLDKWCFALKSMQDLQGRPAAFRKEIFRRLFEIAEVEGMPKEERIQYEKNMTTERDLRNQMAYAKEIAMAEGLAQGRTEGHTQGHAEGRTQGHAEGLKEGIRQTAKAMLSLGIDRDIIARCTGLSPEEMEAL